MKIESTAAKIGRSMKKRENMATSSPQRLSWLLGDLLFSRLLGHLHRRARADLHHAVDDHLLAGLQAGGDDPVVARPVADLHRPRLGRALLVDHVDELALRAFQHRALRHGDRVRARRAVQHHAHELARAQQRRPWVRQLGARFLRAGGRGDAHVGEVEPPGVRVDRAVGEAQRDLEAAVLRQLQAAGLRLPSAGARARCPGCRSSPRSGRPASRW